MKQAEGGGIAVINGIRVYGNPKSGFSLSLSLSLFVALCKVSWGRGLVVMVWLSLCYSCTDLRLCFYRSLFD